MTKSEIRNNNEARATKHGCSSSLVIRHWFGLRISDFVICLDGEQRLRDLVNAGAAFAACRNDFDVRLQRVHVSD